MQKLIVGNWKMNGSAAMAHGLAEAVAAGAAHAPASVTVVLCPPAVLAVQLVNWLIGSKVRVGGQDCHARASGAFTGDISAPMLAEAGCAYVIIGHSERRMYHMETSDMIGKKAAAAMKAQLMPIVCVGETLDERDNGVAEEIVGRQVRESLPDEATHGHFALAYEPVWAIGSGRTPTRADIARMHAVIQAAAAERTGKAAERILVLYGGSVNGGNAREILATPGVSGVLVGGASLKAEEFCNIIECGVSSVECGSASQHSILHTPHS